MRTTSTHTLSQRRSEALEAARLNPERSLRSGQGSALRGVLVNLALGGAKLAAGLLGHSYALIADASDSFADVMSSCVTLYGLRLAAEPEDQTHPAGHGRAETLAAALTAVGLTIVGGLISLHIARHAPSPWALFVLLPVILVKEWLFHVMYTNGKKTGSVALINEAWHQRSDVLTSVSAVAGITIAWIGGPAWNHADSWAALVSSLWLIGTGLWLLGPTLHELMEGSVDPDLQDFIYETSRSCPGIRGIDKVWVRKLGMRLMVDMHVEVDPEISVQEGHRLAHEVKAKLQRELPQVRNVMVHVEPYDPGRPKQPYRIRTGGNA